MTSRAVGWVDSATTAFEDALADLIGGFRLDVDPTEIGRRAALEAVSGAMWADEIGPFYDSEGVMMLLGGVTKQAVNDRARRHRMLALRTGSGRPVYPAFQFDGPRVVGGLGAVLDALVPDDTEAWLVASWLSTNDPALGERAPIHALHDGDADLVIEAARDVASTLRG